MAEKVATIRVRSSERKGEIAISSESILILTALTERKQIMATKTVITKEDLAQFTGTTRYFSHWSNLIVFTDGVKYMADMLGAYWLIDVVASYQPVNVNFQAWKLQKEGNGFVVTCEDGNEKLLIRQELEYTDFQEDLMPFELYLQNKVLFLPSEY